MTEQQVVTWRQFDEIECNRCGECCEGFSIASTGYSEQRDDGAIGWWLHAGPLGYIEVWAYWQARGEKFEPFGPDSDLWYAQLEPFWSEEHGWKYKCGHFERDADGLGVCTIYETRPPICSGYPYGRPQTEFEQCAWNVEVRV